MGVPWRCQPAALTANLAEQVDPKTARKAIAAKTGDDVVDLDRPVRADEASVRFILPKVDDPDALHVIRHSAAHVMAEAICALWPRRSSSMARRLKTGSTTTSTSTSPCPPRTSRRSRRRWLRSSRQTNPSFATRSRGPTPWAVSRPRAIPTRSTTPNVPKATCCRSTPPGEPGKDFEDLCRGPHVPSTGKIGAFKVLQVSGAYYRGDASNKQLQRVYGTAWPSQGRP